MMRPKHLDTYKEPWLYACFDAGVQPREATADDILGPAIGAPRDHLGQRVLLRSDLQTPQIEPDPDVAPLSEFTLEVTEIASLTPREAAVVACIADGVEVGHGVKTDWTLIVADRLGISPSTVRSHWQSARRKLTEEWTSAE